MDGSAPTNLARLSQDLLEKASEARARRAAATVYGGQDAVLRQTVMALLAGTELPEHESPPEATLQVLAGRLELRGRDRSWQLGAGDLLPIPPERHSVLAQDDSVFLLTVRRSV